MYCIYVLKSRKDGRLYIGSTGNLDRRLEEHSLGKVASTRHRLPLELVYKESVDTKQKAQARERYFKGGGKAHNTLKTLIGD